MNGQTTVELSFIISLISALSVIIGIITVIRKGAKDDSEDKNSLKEGILKANIKLDNICTTMASINTDIRDIKKEQERMNKIQIEHEARISHLEKNIQK